MNDWNGISDQIGLDNMWNINKEFLNQQISQGKQSYTTHDPFEATGYFKNEVDFLEIKGYTFEKEGDLWKAVPKDQK